MTIQINGATFICSFVLIKYRTTCYINSKALSITGARSMSEWDAFVDQAMSSFDVDRMKELSDQAVENYLNK